MNCYCCSGKKFESCCQPYLESKEVLDTAEQLMRSRYCAFVLLNESYLRLTWAAAKCPQELGLDAATKWVKLQIISTEGGQRGDQTGKVEFKAWFIHRDELVCLHEISGFEREGGCWVYHSGQLFDEPAEALTMKQNCPCGSGKKYKHCCRKE